MYSSRLCLCTDLRTSSLAQDLAKLHRSLPAAPAPVNRSKRNSPAAATRPDASSDGAGGSGVNNGGSGVNNGGSGVNNGGSGVNGGSSGVNGSSGVKGRGGACDASRDGCGDVSCAVRQLYALSGQPDEGEESESDDEDEGIEDEMEGEEEGEEEEERARPVKRRRATAGASAALQPWYGEADHTEERKGLKVNLPTSHPDQNTCYIYIYIYI